MNAALFLVYALIALNALVSWQGLKSPAFFERYKFEVDRVLGANEYYRIATSGFLHVNWMHLLFNMVSLYAFAESLALVAGIVPFLLIYFGSLVGGSLLALLLHRQHGDYSAVGASGAVCGVVFASIALFPDTGIRLFALPVALPNWLYGLLFVLISLYGIKTRRDNIGHEAHLGGAVCGILIATAFFPDALRLNFAPILIVLLPTIALLCVVFFKPHLLLIDAPVFRNRKKPYNVDHRYNERQADKKRQLDALLEKIGRKGIESLSEKERRKLDELSK